MLILQESWSLQKPFNRESLAHPITSISPSHYNHINIKKKLNINFWVSPPQKRDKYQISRLPRLTIRSFTSPSEVGCHLSALLLIHSSDWSIEGAERAGVAIRSPGADGNEFRGGGETSKDRTLRQAELGGFNIFLFSPRKLGEDEPNLTIRIFFRWGGKKPPTSNVVLGMFWGVQIFKTVRGRCLDV